MRFTVIGHASLYIETDGPDGKLATFEVKYTFGIEPLQQYLVEFPDGRLQALSIAWDSRPADKDGQRWLHLSPNEKIAHDDVLHWTRLNQNWNFMCAECHSTGVRKNYDAKADRFATAWAEISVGCEACHGQGSRHAAWARDQRSWWPFGKRADSSKGLLVRFDERRDVAWPMDAQTGNARRSIAPATLRKEVETCGLCHARLDHPVGVGLRGVLGPVTLIKASSAPHGHRLPRRQALLRRAVLRRQHPDAQPDHGQRPHHDRRDTHVWPPMRPPARRHRFVSVVGRSLVGHRWVPAQRTRKVPCRTENFPFPAMGGSVAHTVGATP